MKPIRLSKLRKVKQEVLSTGTPQGMWSIHTGRVSEYVLQLLRGESSTESQLGRVLTPSSYIALLPVIWALLNNASLRHRGISNTVLRATIDHSVETSYKSSLKRLTIEFVARLMLVRVLEYHIL